MRSSDARPGAFARRSAQPAAGGHSDEEARVERLLARIEMPSPATTMALSAGRELEITRERDGDRLRLRDAEGALVVEIAWSSSGPVIRATGAELEIAARRVLSLSAPELRLSASQSMVLDVGGDVATRIGGNRHTRIDGEEHLEAAAIGVQANERNVHVRAMGPIALDGEHVGLNDDPCPKPFPWSEISDG